MQYGVRMNELAFINNIHNDNIFPGQVLKVPNPDMKEKIAERKA